MSEEAKRGPKEKYTPEACNKILEVAARGGHVSSMALAAGARSKTTFYKWQEEHPEFKEAYEYAKLISLDWWENEENTRSMNATKWMMIVQNKFRDDYQRSGTGSHTEINLTSNTLNLTAEEMRDKIAQTAQRLKLLGDNVLIGNLTDTTRIIDSAGTEGTTS